MAGLSFRSVAAAVLLAVPAMVAAQPASTYPDRPVRVVNPSSPGGGADVISRIVMQEVSKSLGQTFIIDNRPGAANIIATEIAAKAPPDGYTLLIAATGTFVTNPLLYAKLPYSINDFETISIVADAPFILSVHPSVPARTVKELIGYAKAQDGKLTFASFGRGSSSHLAGELFQSVTGTKLVHVPYKGAAPGMADLVAGQITMAFDSGLSSIPHVNAKRIRPLGVAAPQRLPSIPDVPTLAEQGLGAFDAGTWYGVMAPARTPKPIIDRLHGAIVRALALPDVTKKINDLGTAVIGNTPAEFSAQIARESERWAAVVKQAGLKPE
ncbi:MAG: tripartite tricarboxylate transporter substrate binding protein [Rhodocyclaceae bacterium]|nr:tripartite tricarboxylate transporter substrate binding protein [Rhodocyclaceae bacterium]MCA3089953.1 tripartite tricarboxylate transporter substrate binding protein [Rhodocyclaceae bacterium]MCA3093601.1 tripartite tricarboxylate transporter substrate binding protein [Rhodocyclaceae bacterium]MCA3101135.1 tripartite tricarboxylate transporter substrate binding protein [Rhodocyclaceae bacterium]MCA3105093.1 tripartite tricarboxylate transporter substrate binding protein [Rhodocyclaceae bact